MEDAGDIASASALSILVVFINVAVKLGYEYFFNNRKVVRNNAV